MKGGFGTPSNLGGASTRNLGGPSNILSDLIGGISGPNGIGLETGCGSRSIGGLLKSSRGLLKRGSLSSNLGPSCLTPGTRESNGAGPLGAILGCSSNLGGPGLPGPRFGGSSISIGAPEKIQVVYQKYLINIIRHCI